MRARLFAFDAQCPAYSMRCPPHALGVFPSPLWGGVGGGGSYVRQRWRVTCTTPLPSPPPQRGEGADRGRCSDGSLQQEKLNARKRYGRNSARMRLQPSAGGGAGSGAGSSCVSPLGPGSSGGGTSGITAGTTGVISRPRGARDSSAVAAAIARRALRPPAEKGSG